VPPGRGHAGIHQGGHRGPEPAGAPVLQLGPVAELVGWDALPASWKRRVERYTLAPSAVTLFGGWWIPAGAMPGSTRVGTEAQSPPGRPSCSSAQVRLVGWDALPASWKRRVERYTLAPSAVTLFGGFDGLLAVGQLHAGHGAVGAEHAGDLGAGAQRAAGRFLPASWKRRVERYTLAPSAVTLFGGFDGDPQQLGIRRRPAPRRSRRRRR
jgi:hypothetical protein